MWTGTGNGNNAADTENHQNLPDCHRFVQALQARHDHLARAYEEDLFKTNPDFVGFVEYGVLACVYD
jgi:hypothetical protein